MSLLALHPRDHGREAVELKIWNPSQTVNQEVLGEPFFIYPHETAAFEGGFTVQLAGYGHKIKMDRSDLPFATVRVALEDEETEIRLFPSEEGDSWGISEWNGYVIEILEADAGPPHRADATTRMVVYKK